MQKKRIVTYQPDRSVFSKFKLVVDIYIHCYDLLKSVVEFFPQGNFTYYPGAPRDGQDLYLDAPHHGHDL